MWCTVRLMHVSDALLDNLDCIQELVLAHIIANIGVCICPTKFNFTEIVKFTFIWQINNNQLFVTEKRIYSILISLIPFDIYLFLYCNFVKIFYIDSFDTDLLCMSDFRWTDCTLWENFDFICHGITLVFALQVTFLYNN